MTEAIRITGMKELVDAIRRLPDKVQKKIERTALRKALAPLKASAEQKAPVKSGQLRGSFKIKTRSKRGQLIGEVIAEVPHAHLVEYGHRLVRGGRDIGFVAAHPFMRPALDETAQEVLNIAASEVAKAFVALEKKGD